MNKIVRERYPVAELPEDLREGFAAGDVARVVVEVERREGSSLEQLLRLRPRQGMTREAILAQIEELRGEYPD